MGRLLRPGFLPPKSRDTVPSGALTTRSKAFLSFISRQPTHCRWGIFFTFGIS